MKPQNLELKTFDTTHIHSHIGKSKIQ